MVKTHMVNVTIYESIEDETIRKKVIGNLTEYRDHVAGLKNANTLRAYNADFADYLRFCHEHDLVSMSEDWQITKGSVKGFFDFLMWRKKGTRTTLTSEERSTFTSQDIQAMTLKRASITRKLAAIRYFIGIAELDDPYIKSKLLREYVSNSLNRYKPEYQDQATPLTLELVDELEHLLPATTLLNIRDLMLVNVGFDTLLRASNLTMIDINHLRLDIKSIFVPSSKTDKTGKGSLVYIGEKSISLIKLWLEKSGVVDGKLFRALTPKKLNVKSDGLSYKGMYHAYKRLGVRLNIDGLSCHSTRVGAVVSQTERNVSIKKIIQSGQWKSERMAIRYGEKANVNKGGMSDIR
jgi:site-specific recombinase XerD